MGVSVQKTNYQKKANNVFTDRIEPRNAFWIKYERYKENMEKGIDNDVQILTYYGIGGAGKSTLLLKLQEELITYAKKENSKWLIPYAFYDLETNSSKLGILSNLKNLLETKYDFKFPLYKLALNIYLIKTGNEPIFEDEDGFIEKNKYAGIATDIVSAGVDALNIIPVAGALTSSALKLIDNLVAGHKKRYAKHQIETSDLQERSANEIWRILQLYFAKDLAENIKDLKYPLVIFLDTYEQLVNELASIGEPLLNDDWLRDLRTGLVTNVSNCIWVIAGREILKWEQFYPDWKDSVEQHLIGNLSEVDVTSFLEESGIKDLAIQEQIYTITKGTPVYLDICVFNYYNILQTGGKITEESLGKDDKELMARFLKYTDNNVKDVLYLLSCLDEWTEEEFINTSVKCLKAVSYSLIEKIKEYSFIEISDGKNYRMHQIIRRVLNSYCPKSIKREVALYQMISIREQLDQMDFISKDYTKLLKRYIAVCFQLDDIRDKEEAIYNEVYEKYIKTLFGHYHYEECCNIMEMFVQHIDCREDESILKARIYIDYTKCLLSAKQYNHVLTYAQKAIAIFQMLDSQNDFINANIILSQIYSKLGRHDEAIELADNMLTLRMEERREKSTEVHFEISAQFNLGDRFYDSGFVLDAITVYEKTLRNCVKFYGERHQASIEAMNKLVELYNIVGRDQDALNMLEESIELTGNDFALMIPILQMNFKYTNRGNYQEALSINQRIYDIYVKFFGEDDIRTVHLMEDMAIKYLDAGNEEEAIKYINKYLEHVKENLDIEPLKIMQTIEKKAKHLKLIEKYQISLCLYQALYELKVKLNGEQTQETIQLLQDMASINKELENFNQALILYEKIADYLKERYGDDSPETLNSLRSIAELYIDHNRLEEALHVYESMKASFAQNYGEEYPDTLRVEGEIANIYRLLKQYDESCQRYEKALESCKRVLGEKHYVTLDIMEALSYLYRELDRESEAIALYNEFYFNYKAAHGLDDYITIHLARNLVSMYCLKDRFQEAASIMEEFYELRESRYGKDNRLTIEVIRDLIDIYCQSQNYQDAIRMARQILDLKVEKYGMDHKETIEESCRLAMTYNRCKKNQEAVEISLAAVEVSNRLLGDAHKITIDAVTVLAYIYCGMGNQEEAIVMLLNNLEIEKRIFGNESQDTLDVLEYAYKKAGKISEEKK